MPANPNTTLIQARCPADLAARLHALAEENDRTPSAELRRAVKLYLKSSEAAGQGDLAKIVGAGDDVRPS